MNEILTFEAFSGYNVGFFALLKANIKFKCVGISEIDKNAIKCTKLNFPNYKNFGSISEINTKDLPDFDLFMGGFPCQDVSLAGKRDLSKGRTMLINHVFRIIADKKPRFVFLENVKGLLSMDSLWESIKFTLMDLGYDIRYTVLNSKNYGVPQNRERVYILCDREGFEPFKQVFPQKEKLNIFLKDILEEDVDEKYFLTENQMKRLMYSDDIKKGFSKINSQIAGTLTARQYANYKDNFLTEPFIVASRGRYSKKSSVKKITEQILEPKFDGTANTITSVQKDNYICLRNATKIGFKKAYPYDGIKLDNPKSDTNRGRVQNNMIPSLTCAGSVGVVTPDMIIRRLTPKECFRLMGFLNDEININGLSDSALYKLAGNGWDIMTVSKIFKSWLGDFHGKE